MVAGLLPIGGPFIASQRGQDVAHFGVCVGNLRRREPETSAKASAGASKGPAHRTPHTLSRDVCVRALSDVPPHTAQRGAHVRLCACALVESD